MEQIKISVDVNINLSEDVKSFIAQVITSASKPAPAASKPAAQVSASKPAAQVSASKPAPTASKPAAQVSTSKPVAPAASEISIEDVRKALSLKVNSHRTEIKSKLNEFGAPSVTKLNPANYQEMLDFLNTLD